MVLGVKNMWRRMIDPVTSMQQMLEVSPEELTWLKNGGEAAAFGAELASQASLMRTILIANGSIEPGDPVPDEFVSEFLKWVTMHEVGHTLGLRHNFRSSTDTPMDKLHDKAWTDENGVFSSVMGAPPRTGGSRARWGGRHDPDRSRGWAHRDENRPRACRAPQA